MLSSPAVSGVPTVLAKPANSVMPVMVRRVAQRTPRGPSMQALTAALVVALREHQPARRRAAESGILQSRRYSKMR